MPLLYPLVFAAFLFSAGVYGVLARRNAVMVLMSIELMLNAVNVNLVAFNAYLRDQLVSGQVFALFVIAVAAADAYHAGTGWAPIGQDFEIPLGMTVDGLAAVLLVVVTTVSLFVQIYSVSYMRGDERYTLFFAKLSLFTAGMLIVVLADNLLLLLVGWEIMGVCSYFLIGHWWEDAANARAAVKAFLTTRVGDLGFMAGIFVLFWAAGGFEIERIVDGVESGRISSATVTLGAALLFCGAIGKSGQFPLHTWLPDAMAGPTPVSALIHAATMVAAGVFLVARMYPVFE